MLRLIYVLSFMKQNEPLFSSPPGGEVALVSYLYIDIFKKTMTYDKYNIQNYRIQNISIRKSQK